MGNVHPPRSRVAPRAGSAALALAAGFAVSGVATTARADNSPSNPNLIPLGETEAFLGNAGVGRANDTGAVYYNPSGLAELESGRVSVSGAVYMSFSVQYQAALNIDNTNIPLKVSGFDTIPSTYVATRRLGDWVAAFSVIVPNSMSLSDHVSFTTPNTTTNVVYSTQASDLWIGLSLAHKLGDHFSLGATIFGMQHSETQVIGVDVENGPNAFGTNLERTSLDALGLSAVVGATYIPTDWLRIGLRAQTPFIQVHGSGDTYEITHPLGGASTSEDIQGGGNYGKPFDFTLGAAVTPAPWLTLLADVSLQLALSFTEFPSSNELDDVTSYKAAPRVNVGAEVLPDPSYPIRVGFLYDPNANSGNPGDPGYAGEDFFGVTAGVGFTSPHVKTCVGGFYLWSNGQATVSGTNNAVAAYNSTAFGALLTTAYAF
ncbi:MAG TPA: outer membrane protein transport protein [Polyangiaceae bacterium]